MGEVGINKGYELYQIITDFGEPLEIFREAFQNAIDEGAKKVFCNIQKKQQLNGYTLIIEIWNNGNGLDKENIDNFFGLAKTTKTYEGWIPSKEKVGYKGHGSKIFFNAEKVTIYSKSSQYHWFSQLDDPIKQLEEYNTFHYSDPQDIEIEKSLIPNSWSSGFGIRIVNPRYFKTQHTLYKLDHLMIRDYAKWFTVFGSIDVLFNQELKDNPAELNIRGLNFENFKSTYNNINEIDPLPEYSHIEEIEYECLIQGHYFPPQRYLETDMKKYAKEINYNKPYYDLYSKMILREKISCPNEITFKFVINVEGYETKRRYNKLLSKRGITSLDNSYTDSARYGLWACKNGIPIEKIDNWIEGGRGTYSYFQGFVDCDNFSLTANRGTMQNSDMEIIDIVKDKVNEILKRKEIEEALNERNLIEIFENQLKNIEETEQQLNERYRQSKHRKRITLPDGTVWFAPSKMGKGYSESETLILLVNIIAKYNNFFSFKLLDYNTQKGIDFIVEYQSFPRFIELKGSLQRQINHPLRYIHKFICYDLGIKDIEIIEDIENIRAAVKIIKEDSFRSFDDNFKNKKYTSYQLIPDSASVTSIEIIRLKTLLKELLGAEIED